LTALLPCYRLHPSKGGTPALVYVLPGDHQWDAGASAVIVKFFKEFGKRP
jgi:hypothetical protein